MGIQVFDFNINKTQTNMGFEKLHDAEKAYFILALGELLNADDDFSRLFCVAVGKSSFASVKFEFSQRLLKKEEVHRLNFEVNGLSMSENFARNVSKLTGEVICKDVLGDVIWGRSCEKFHSDLWTFAVLLRDVASHPDEISTRVATNAPNVHVPELVRAGSAYLLGELIAPGLLGHLYNIYSRVELYNSVPRLTDLILRTQSTVGDVKFVINYK